MLEKEKSTKAEDFQNADALQKELETLATSKKQLLAEVDSLQKTISELQEKTQAAEQQITDRFTTELKTKTDLLAKESTKSTNLTNLINALKSQENNDKMAVEKLKAEKNSMTEKYNRMAAEHSQAFSVSNPPNSIRKYVLKVSTTLMRSTEKQGAEPEGRGPYRRRRMPPQGDHHPHRPPRQAPRARGR
jgi:chromosome segregation ATPase